MRAFYAFPIPEETKNELQAFLGPLKSNYEEIKWVKRYAMHITVLFLGDLDDEQVEHCITLIQSPELKRPPFTVRFQGMATFPPKKRPRVIYAPIFEGYSECIEVYESIRSRIDDSIEVDNKKFTPHITLGRVKKRTQIPTEEEFTGLEGAFTVDRCILYRSILRPDGPEYRELAAAEFE